MNYPIFTSVCLAVYLVYRLLKKENRVRLILALLVGFGAAQMFAGWIGGGLDSIGGMAFGLVLPALLGVFCVAWMIFTLKEKRQHKWNDWIALLTATFCLIATPSVPILDNINKTGDSIMQTGNSTVTGGNGIGGGTVKVKKAKTRKTSTGVKMGPIQKTGK